ncbi:MAG: 16S rRNA (guanine(966)-N(2))-methyltransferase RsmD [Planctomycetaceae bacterium]|nr:16S rRNA (guanine(966)-N(2))-methyltransferase RsmD [Planctomycetaceae bacterium]
MRIVSGRFRRRKLLASPGKTTRPITDRARESLFARLEDELEGSRVADVFSGTGTLGLESLSRGAESAIFFENDRKAVELLRRNIETLDVGSEVFAWQVDILRTSFRPGGQEQRLPYDVVFFDPPYRMAYDIRPGEPLYRSLVRLAREGISRTGTLLVLRTARNCDLTLPECWVQFDSMLMQSMEIRLCRLAEPVVPATKPSEADQQPDPAADDVSTTDASAIDTAPPADD